MSILNTWYDRVNADTIRHSLVTALGHYTVGSGKRNNLSEDEVRMLVRIIRFRGEKIRADEESTERGLRWLRNLALTPAGKLRRNSPINLRHLDIIQDASHIELVNYTEDGRPMYRVVSHGGGNFTYSVGRTMADAMSGLRGDTRVVLY